MLRNPLIARAEATSDEQMMKLPLPRRVSLAMTVALTLDLEHETTESLCTPSTVGVAGEVVDTTNTMVDPENLGLVRQRFTSRNQTPAPAPVELRPEVELLGTKFSTTIDGTHNLAVDLSKNFSAENVSEFALSIKTVNSLEVLSEFSGVLSLEARVLASTAVRSMENAIWGKFEPLKGFSTQLVVKLSRSLDGIRWILLPSVQEEVTTNDITNAVVDEVYHQHHLGSASL